MKHFLAQLVASGPLSRQQTHDAFGQIMSGQATQAQTAALLALIQARGATVDEIVGAAEVMRQKATAVQAPKGLTLVDTCGMGGTGSQFFNISTTAALVVAGTGRPRGVAVAKHGNRAITSRCGSAQVLEALGVNLNVASPTITRCLDEAGIGFCFAPAHHGAMKHAMPVRQELGFRTIFNLLGPLTNPAGVKRQLIGVPSLDLTDMIALVLKELGAQHAIIVHSVLPDGTCLGEFTTFGPNQVCELHNGMIKNYQIDPGALDLPFAVPDSVTVESAQQSAAMVQRVLSGKHGPARDIVRLNSAAALIVAGLAKDYAEGLDQATEAIDSGAAQKALDTLVKITQSETTG